jgi:hypothetical protein
MSWRSRRKLKYFSFVLILLFVGASFLIYPIITKKPTCFDKKQNGNEQGTDCGGICILYCPYSVPVPKIKWSLIFPITQDVYNVVVYVVNNSPESGSRYAPYTITLYDENNNVIIERKGSTFITPATSFAVFEPQIQTGKRIPKKAILVWDEDVILYEKTDTRINSLAVYDQDFVRETVLGVEKVTAFVKNDELFDIPQSEYIIIVYDENDQPIAASKTKSSILSRSLMYLNFSWPYEFSRSPKRYELIKRINPYELKIK